MICASEVLALVLSLTWYTLVLHMDVSLSTIIGLITVKHDVWGRANYFSTCRVGVTDIAETFSQCCGPAHAVRVLDGQLVTVHSGIRAPHSIVSLGYMDGCRIIAANGQLGGPGPQTMQFHHDAVWKHKGDNIRLMTTGYCHFDYVRQLTDEFKFRWRNIYFKEFL